MEKTKSFNSAIITYFVITASFVLLRMLSSFGVLTFMGEYGDYFFTIIVQIVLLLGGPLLLYPALKKQKPFSSINEFGSKKISWSVVGLSFLLGVVVYFLNSFVADAFYGIIEFLGYEHASGAAISSYSFGTLLLNLLFTAFLPALCEETTHRGMLLRSFSPLGTWKAIMLSSILFGLLHLNIEQFFYATIIGLFLGLVTILTNSLVPAIIVHFVNNALSVYLTFSRVNGLPFGRAVVWFNAIINSNIFLGIFISLLTIVVLVYLAFVLTRAITKRRVREDVELFKEQVSKKLLKQAYLLDIENAKFNMTGKFDEKAFESLKQFVLFQDEDNEDFRPSKYSKLVLWTILAMGTVLTICTFVWGVL